jgi:hypothetical protein
MAWHCRLGCRSWYNLGLLPWGHTQHGGACKGPDYLWYGTLVLFRVTRWYKCGVSLRVRFAVGFRACKIGGAFVMRGTSGAVMMGLLSIILRSCICISLALTLFSSKALVGFKIFLIFAWMSLMSHRPFCVALAIAVDLANLSVSTRKCWCWCGVRFVSWQCCRISLVKPEIQYARVLEKKYKLHR